jgi:hypothetical protein
MLCRRPELHDALKALTDAALNDLLQHDDAPVIGPLPDMRHPRRFSQSSFVALRASNVGRFGGTPVGVPGR